MGRSIDRQGANAITLLIEKKLLHKSRVTQDVFDTVGLGSRCKMEKGPGQRELV